MFAACCCLSARLEQYEQLKSVEAAAEQYSSLLTGQAPAPDQQAWSRLNKQYEALLQQHQQQEQQQAAQEALVQELLASMAPSQV